MEIAPLPHNEIERLQALHEYDVFDSPNDALMDGIAQLAAQICGVPIALVSLIDRDRQWFKAQFGLPGIAETSRDFAFCAHTILRNELMEVADAARDVRFADNPMVLSAPNIRFYAGMPLINPQGFALGTLCVVDHHPRRLTDEQRNAMTCLSRLAVALLEQHKVTRSLQRSEERLAHQVHYDALTDLPNRLLFRDRLQNALAQAHRNHWITGVLLIDLDRFKVVNDTLGHGFGDRLIQLVAQRLLACLRDGDTVCRLGGDEFAVLLPDLSAADDASQVAQKIAAALAAPFDLDGHEHFVTASIGIAIHPGDGDDADTLIRNADTAMYSAKALGGNHHQFYNARMNALALERMRLESSLRRALERGEFLLHYQPKLDVPGGDICGAEALLRWKHPQRGLVSPAEFIPLLEETGLILPVGLWVLETACAQMRSWREAGIDVPPIAINLSVRQFQQTDLDVRMRDIIIAAGVSPADIELEITESMLMQDPQQAVQMLTKLKQLGVRISVDDFGTGYSSLAYLKQFPLDALKIDRAFISHITHDQNHQDDATIALTIINLAHNLKLKVVAEGVETEAQARFLTRHGCDVLQGFYFSRPIAPDDFAQMLKTPARFALPERMAAVPSLKRF
ncbi:MAG: EAL domain-containing protein [Spongiibacteraceae bacterium]